MRVLLTTRGSAGHVNPLAPFGQACVRAGHEVLVVAQRQFAGNVERTGLEHAPVDDPPPEAWMPLLEEFGQLDLDTSNAKMVGEFFARIDTVAALPGLREVVGRWRPDVLVRESWEFASTLVAEERGIPVARIALGLAAMEELTVELAAPALDRLRAEAGLPPDPRGDRLRDAPYLTTIPEALEDPAVAMPERTHRFRAESPAAPAPFEDWWPGQHGPLVYLSFGSVTAAPHLPYFPDLYRAAIAQLAPLGARVLVTVGEDRDLAELGELPPNVHVERWVPQDTVLPHAAAVVGHGGHGSTMGAVVHGVPLVVLPLFSTDQWFNAEAVDRAGVGVAVRTDHAGRDVFARPTQDELEALAAGVERVLSGDEHRDAALKVAAAVAALPPVDAAVDVLAALAA